MENIEEITKKSIDDCAELKRLYKGAISTYRDQIGIAIQVLEEVLQQYDRLAKYVLAKGDNQAKIQTKITVKEPLGAVSVNSRRNKHSVWTEIKVRGGSISVHLE